jgi:PilZ domain
LLRPARAHVLRLLMEHRCGHRWPANVGARIRFRDGSTRVVRIRNIGLGGAWLQVATHVAAGRLTLYLPTYAGKPALSIAAHIVRTAPDGIGVEWPDFGPPALENWLRTLPEGAGISGSVPFPPMHDEPADKHVKAQAARNILR